MTGNGRCPLTTHSFMKAFTLLEVLITLSVLSISLLGIYSLVNSSIRMAGGAEAKAYVINKGYERVMMRHFYPRLSLGGTLEEDGREISYSEKKEATEVPGLMSVSLTVKSDSAAVNFEFFER